MTYEYLCTACEHVWEAEQSISEAPLKVCPLCKKEAAKRQVSGGAGFILKGGGWYSDLYGSAPKKTTESAESSGGDAKKSAETKTSDAPAAGKEASKSASSSDGGGKGSGSGSGSKGSTDSSAA